MVQVTLPGITWEQAFCTSVAKVNGIAIGHVSLRGRPDQRGAFEVALYNSKGMEGSKCAAQVLAAKANVSQEEAAKARFVKMAQQALANGTPSNVLTAVMG